MIMYVCVSDASTDLMSERVKKWPLFQPLSHTKLQIHQVPKQNLLRKPEKLVKLGANTGSAADFLSLNH